MIVGILKEIKTEENRVCMTPAGAEVMKMNGHQVLVEKRAGVGSGFEDSDYAAVGAELVATPQEIYERADMVMHVKEPLPSEYDMIREGQIVFTYLHLAAAEEHLAVQVRHIHDVELDEMAREVTEYEEYGREGAKTVIVAHGSVAAAAKSAVNRLDGEVRLFRPITLNPFPDAALAAIGREAGDWEGGTRIGTALERFNKDWSRRVLGRGAVVLLITDGLEREGADLLAAQMERLHLSARALIWLNPLLALTPFQFLPPLQNCPNAVESCSTNDDDWSWNVRLAWEIAPSINVYASWATGYKAPSFLQAKGAKEVGVEFFSLSKSYSMPGWRVGFCVGNPEIVAALRRIKSYLDYGIFQPIQIASIIALNGPQECVAEIRDTYKSRRDALISGLSRVGWEIESPKGTMFVWARIPEQYRSMGSVEFSKFLIREAQVAVSPGLGFGEYGDDFVRFALIENNMRINQAVRGIRSVLK